MRYLPNILTASRFVLACVFAGLMFEWLATQRAGLFVWLMILFAAICLTDFFDGKAARALKATTVFGGLMDVVVDLFFIVSSLVVLNIFHIAPLWFTIIVLIKFVEFCLTSRFLRDNATKSAFVPDIWGRIAAVLFYLMPGAVCLLYQISFSGWRTAAYALMIGTGLTALISSYIRCRSCLKISRDGKQGKST